MISRQSEDSSKVDHQIALPNIRSYPDSSSHMDSSEKEDDDDERVDVVGTTDSHTDTSHGKFGIDMQID